MNRLAVTLVLGTWLIGCSSAPPPRTPGMTRLGVRQTTAEMRILLNEYLRWFTAEIAAAADAVIAAEEDPAVQEAAVRFKANAVPAMQAALFQRDPLAALVDGWALTASMVHYFEEDKGRELFGGSQSQVVETLHGLEREIEAIVENVVGKEETDVARAQVDGFVRVNPLRDLSFGRRSAGLQASAVTAAAWGTGGGMRSVAQLDETARDMSDRLTLYGEQLPQIARWQGELMLLEARREFLAEPFAKLDALESEIGAIEKDIDTITGFFTSTPDLVAAERALMVETLQEERAILLSSIDVQRRETLAALTAEREAILAAAEELRRASFTDLGTEAERSLDRMDGLSTAVVQELARITHEAIDHLFWRALQLLLVGFAASAVLAFALRLTRRQSGA